jgi:hypothetical protein
MHLYLYYSIIMMHEAYGGRGGKASRSSRSGAEYIAPDIHCTGGHFTD